MNQFCHSLCRTSGVLLYGLYDGAAHNGGISKFASLSKLLGIGNPKSNRDRQAGVLADAPHKVAGIALELVLRAGDPGARDSIHKTTTRLSNLFQALVSAGGCSQKDRRQMVGFHAA